MGRELIELGFDLPSVFRDPHVMFVMDVGDDAQP